MICRDLIDRVYDSIGEGPLPFLFKLKLRVHSLGCHNCDQELKKLEQVQELLENGFFPEQAHFEERIMALVYREDIESVDPDPATGVSFRGWVVTGLIILISLSTSFFGMDFMKLARSQGSSFLLPVGLTIGSIVTGYGALFIASHLKELSQRFGLH